MMNLQDGIVLVIVAIAAVYVGRAVLIACRSAPSSRPRGGFARSATKKSCGGCASCPSTSPEVGELIPSDALIKQNGRAISDR
jgi:hypothetical protein